MWICLFCSSPRRKYICSISIHTLKATQIYVDTSILLFSLVEYRYILYLYIRVNRITHLYSALSDEQDLPPPPVLPQNGGYLELELSAALLSATITRATTPAVNFFYYITPLSVSLV